jgi:dolichol-phosphate mannosyltransferase
MSRVVVVIPTYNEAENLKLLVPQVLAQDPRIEVLVVDDSSPDGTGKIVDELAAKSPGRVHVLHREEKQGLGPAYRAGLRKALELGAAYVVQMDADFSHPPATLPILLKEIESCDVVLGSRYLKGITVVNWPIERILISYFGEQIGFERIRSDGYAFQIEMNYRFRMHGARIKEIPFFFLDRERGVSKLSLRIALEALWIVWWLRVAHWLGRI